MNVVRNFLLLGSVFLIIGLFIGMYMGGSGDHTLAPSHAHINLVGFVITMIFALTYKAFPAMLEGRLAGIHFWCHLVGAVGLNIMLFMLMAGMIGPESMAPIAPITELLVTIGVAIFAWNIFRHA